MVQNQIQQNYIGINGIVTQDLKSIIAELEDDFKNIYGDNINLESNTSDGQWLNILAQQKIDALDFQVQLYNNLDVDSVVGLPQQVLYKLNGLSIKDFTYSWVYINVTISQNVTLSGLDGDIANVDGTGYTVSDINGNNWILAESISLVQSETPYLLLFRAQELGQITALANTITTMSTIIAGVTEVNNPANNFITGQTGETAAEFRTRRNRSMQAPSQGFKESIEGQLLALNDVSDAKVYDSNDDENINGVQVIVQGGTGQEIGNIIYNNLPPGINTQGAYTATINVNNRDKVLNYDKPNPIPILVKGTIESLTGNQNDIDLDYVKRTLASRVFNIGELAESANITTEIKNIVGETGSPYDVMLSMGLTGGEWEAQTKPDTTEESGINGILYQNSTYIVCGDDGFVATSSDLSTWTTQTVGTSKWNGIKYIGSTYFLYGSGGYIATSSNLSTWNVQRLGSAPNNNDNWVSVITNYDNEVLALARSGRVAKYSSSQWSIIDAISTSSYMNDFVSGKLSNQVFILAAGVGKIAWSVLGTSWSSTYDLKYNGNRVDVQKIKFINDKIICVGTCNGNGIIGVADNFSMTLSNIVWTWKVVGSGRINDIVYGNGYYTIVGIYSYIAMSADLDLWTSQIVGSNSWFSALATDTGYLAGGSSSNLVKYTFPAPDWQEILTPTGLADFFVMTGDGMDNLEVTV